MNRLVCGLLLLAGLALIGHGQLPSPMVVDPGCQLDYCLTGCVEDGPGFRLCWAKARASHYDANGNPLPVTVVAHAQGDAFCCGVNYSRSDEDTSSGYGSTGRAQAEVYVGGWPCNADWCIATWCADRGYCHCYDY